MRYTEKGIIELINAFAQIRKVYSNVILLIVGDTLDSDRDKDAKKELLKTIREKNLDKGVILTGLRDDVPELLAAVDIFVLPSYREGMPNTIIEAMASGKPVVATRIRGCREEVVDGKTGILVDVRDPGSIAEAALRIIVDEEMATSMGEKGRKRAIDLFDEQKVVERQLELFERICEELSGCRDRADT